MPKVSTKKAQGKGGYKPSTTKGYAGGAGSEANRGSRKINAGMGEASGSNPSDSPVKWPILGPEDSVFNKKTKFPVVKVSVVGHGFAG